MILTEAAAILASPPGSLAYHLILTAALALLYAVSQAHHRFTALPRAGRWTLASGWLLSLRLFYLATAAMNWLLIVSGDQVLPALGHFIDLAGLLVFAWAFLVPQSNRRSDRILLSLVVLNVVALGLGLVGPQLGADAIGLPEPRVWAGTRGLGLIAGLGVMLLLLLLHPPQWHLASAGMLTLSAGYTAQLFLAPTVDPLTSYVRLGNLVAYPVLTIAAARALIISQAAEAAAKREETELDKLAFTPTAEAQMAVALASLSTASNREELARRAARAVAETIRSEYCLLVSPPDSAGDFAIATGYDLIREQELPGAAITAEQSPVLASALQQNRVLNLTSRSSSPDSYTLRAMLGLQSTGPVLLVPIATERQIYGGLLLLSPFARRSWSDEQQEMLAAIARHLGDRFSQLQSRAPASSEAYQALLEAQERIHRLERDNMKLFEALHAEGVLNMDQLESIDLAAHEAREAEETIAILEAEIERLKTTHDRPPALPTSEEMEHIKDELQSTLQELMEARAQIEQLQMKVDRSEARPPVSTQDMEAIASIAQELRQPMSSVMGYTDLLLGESVGLLGAMQRKFLERVRGAVERMGRLLNDLVQVTALETGTLDLEPTQVDLLGSIEEAINQVGPAVREKRLTLQMDFPDEVPAVLGDEMAVSQILLHLLKNAIDASPEDGEIQLAARVEQSKEDGFLMLSVGDSGDGIPPEDLGRVFQRLHHSDRLLISGLGDAGVGLSLVKGLSEALGGRVWVESEEGVGSTFTVLLPLAEAHPLGVPEGGEPS